MKTLNRPTLFNKFFIVVLAFLFSAILFAQDDNDNQDVTIKEKKEKKARSSYKVSAGVTLNSLSLDAANGLESIAAAGYNLGISYKRGRFLYYEVGARYNNRYFIVSDLDNTLSTSKSFSVSAVDIPLTAGINITSFADRLVGVRVFLSAVPSFTLGENVDEIGLENDAISSFLFYGQAGVGVDIAFFFVEVGYNYGFDNIIEDITSNPSQGYLNIGFRF